MITVVYNLETGEQREYSCPPYEAVVCAYAQDRHDHSTWLYPQRYSDSVLVGPHTVSCGDWSAFTYRCVVPGRFEM